MTEGEESRRWWGQVTRHLIGHGTTLSLTLLETGSTEGFQQMSERVRLLV